MVHPSTCAGSGSLMDMRGTNKQSFDGGSGDVPSMGAGSGSLMDMRGTNKQSFDGGSGDVRGKSALGGGD
ncbi:hypothetical protein LIER_18574 [Lithospermum erythrorhizon]|uniref:Uncharacterized protein n=1 Tax=Lithospermum erythrorhizon TaxID=34254 RepID=A0AAV3QH49_LITER